ncbi:MAG: LamG-like jellyroll fold domain-containing protein [Shewanella psychromarinicola]|uniref:Calx-beta domain-containing protein n=1 Tax=Shewanella psychromarinicola TaxID=2487742 RepID=UPI0030025565
MGAFDPENEGIASYAWSIIDTRIGIEDKNPITVIPTIVAPTFVSGENTETVSISPMHLLNDTYFIDLQLQVTDGAADPATTTVFITLTILPPLKAAYDFNNYANPRLDWTGNGHQLILNTGDVRITDKNGDGSDYFAKMDANDLFEIDGSAVDGLQVGSASDDQYTILYRFKIDEFHATEEWSNFLLKGSDSERQPGLFVRKSEEALYYSTATTSGNINFTGKENLRLGQWVTGAYVKTSTDILTYIDKVEIKLDDPTTPENLTTVPDAENPKSGTARYNNGNWKFGNATGDATDYLGFVGGIDDIRIYDRALTEAELATLFPAQPRGRFEFNQSSQETEEHLVAGDFITLSVDVDRIEGDDDTVSVGYVLKSGSAILNTDFKLPGSDANALAGKGFLDWGIHDQASKTLTVQILGDNLREGTESFTIELEAQPGEPSIADRNTIDISVKDKTPNVFGAIAFAAIGGGINEAVKEDVASGSITVERIGDDTLGSVDVWFTVKEFSATSPEHFTIGSDHGFPILGSDNGIVVGQGKLTFSGNVTGTPVLSQTQVINFSPVNIAAYDPGKIFAVTLDNITDVGSTVLSDPENSAIMGPEKSYAQYITDVSPGRISFVDANYPAIDEDFSSINRIRDVILERKDGTNGAICVDFDFSGTDISAADYSFNSLAHTGSNDDVYWLDGDSSNKTIQITAENDQAYEVLENLIITWQAKPNCDYDGSAGDDIVETPDAAVAGDNATATLAINDQTNDIELRFDQALHLTTEEDSPDLVVTIYATQTGDLSDPGTFSNNTAFSVYLDRVKISADEVDHYGDLTSQQVISFAAGQTSETITIPIVDNCVSGDFLEFSMNLKNDDASLPVTNPPARLIKVDSTYTKVSIENYSAKPTAVISNHYDGVASDIRADWRSADGDSNLYVTGDISDGQRTPRVTKMGVKADIVHNCYKSLQYTWVNQSNTTPALPAVSGLTSFSVMPAVGGYNKVDASGGGAIVSNTFKLPFIIQDTPLAIELKIVDLEIKDPLIPASASMEYTANSAVPVNKITGLGHAINMKQYFRRIENDNGGGNNCIASNSNTYGNCSSSTDSLLAFNDATDRLVWKATGVKCLTAPAGGGGISSTNCDSTKDATQQWKFLNDDDEEGVQMLNNTNYHLQEFLTGDDYRSGTGGGFGADDFSWYEMSD